jgi:CheY-like chemotaxis protein
MRADLMIVDDAGDQLQLMKIVCKMVDPKIQVVAAKSGGAALEFLRRDLRNLPKVILLDLRMPGRSGLEILSELKSDPVLKKIPVCIFSTSDLNTDICDCYSRGASAFFVKPTGLRALKNFIQSFKVTWLELAVHCDCH